MFVKFILVYRLVSYTDVRFRFQISLDTCFDDKKGLETINEIPRLSRIHITKKFTLNVCVLVCV